MAKGRPKVEINSEMLDAILSFGASCADCAGQFNCSEDTIARFIKSQHGVTFAEYSDKKRALIRNKLRQKQIQMALSGNVALLIFLGKNMLGQADKQEIDASTANRNFNLAYRLDDPEIDA